MKTRIALAVLLANGPALADDAKRKDKEKREEPSRDPKWRKRDPNKGTPNERREPEEDRRAARSNIGS